MFLLAYPVEAIRCSTATLFIQNIAEKEHQCREDLFLRGKTETMQFTENAYLLHFLEGLLSLLHSCFPQKSCMLVGSTFKNMSQDFMPFISLSHYI